ncbi:hypothetical protein [Kitasatospora sp. P5_F3]
MTSAPATTAQHLRHIATHWTDLRDLLTTRPADTWPPTMGLTHYAPDEDTITLQRQAAAAEWAERTALAPGIRPAPLRVSVLDTITELETELLELADQVAGSIQRPAFTIRAASPLDEVARSVAMMSAKDANDPRRWRFNLTPHRTGRAAAGWLASRLLGAEGPFRALSDAEQQHVAAVARSIRRRFDQALGDAPRRAPTPWPCQCGGTFDVVAHAGAEDAAIQCDRCPTNVTMSALIDRLNTAG